MQKEKIALIALVIIVVAALSVFLIAVNTNIFENLFKEKVILSEGDCADVNYIGRYTSNNTVFDTSYTYVENKSGGTPLKIFIPSDTNLTSPKAGYSADLIEGFKEGLIGLQEGQIKTIGPIPPEKAYGANKLKVDAIFTSQNLSFGMNQTVIVTNYTSDNITVKWIQMENLSNFTMPQIIIKNLQSMNETEAVIYPPPYYIWENSTSIINITDITVTTRTTPTKSTNLSNILTPVQYGEKQMMLFPNATTATWNETTITIVSSPVVGQNDTFPYEYYGMIVNITVHINNITGDIINVTVSNDQNPEPSYLDLYRTITFNRDFILPRIYKDIPSFYSEYYLVEDMKKAGYSLDPLAGESLTFEVIVEKVYKTSQDTS